MGCDDKKDYLTASVCEEDITEKVYVNNFSFGLCSCKSWNVPSAGQTALVSVKGVVGASIGSFLWHEAYGYFKLTSVDAEKNLVGITNDGINAAVAPGTQIPAGTCFVVTDPPIAAPGGGNVITLADLYPYVALDFTAPPVTTCVNITVTNINGLSTGDTISIGSGLYTLDSVISSTVIRICNNGQGITPNTPVTAKDVSNNFAYPIYVISSCCTAVTASVAALTTTVTNNNNAANANFADLLGGVVEREVINVAGASTTVGNFIETANTTLLDILNTSATRTRYAFISYEATFAYQYTGGVSDTGEAVGFDILTALNGSPTFVSIFQDGSANQWPDKQFDYRPTNGAGTGTQYAKKVQGSAIYTIAPSTNLTIVAKARINALTRGIEGVISHFRFRGITVRV